MVQVIVLGQRSGVKSCLTNCTPLVFHAEVSSTHISMHGIHISLHGIHTVHMESVSVHAESMSVHISPATYNIHIHSMWIPHGMDVIQGTNLSLACINP